MATNRTFSALARLALALACILGAATTAHAEPTHFSPEYLHLRWTPIAGPSSAGPTNLNIPVQAMGFGTDHTLWLADEVPLTAFALWLPQLEVTPTPHQGSPVVPQDKLSVLMYEARAWPQEWETERADILRPGEYVFRGQVAGLDRFEQLDCRGVKLLDGAERWSRTDLPPVDLEAVWASCHVSRQYTRWMSPGSAEGQAPVFMSCDEYDCRLDFGFDGRRISVGNIPAPEAAQWARYRHYVTTALEGYRQP